MKIFNYYLMNNFYYKIGYNERNYKHNKDIRFSDKIKRCNNNNFRKFKNNMIIDYKFKKHYLDLFSKRDYILKIDGSTFENNKICRMYFKKMKKYYPMWK